MDRKQQLRLTTSECYPTYQNAAFRMSARAQIG